MARNPGSSPSMLKGRNVRPTPKAPARPTAAATPAVADPPKKRTSLAQFIREVRAEARKITWTSWRETWITSIMVFIMVVVTALFFLVVDEGLGQGMKLLLKLAA